MKEFKTDFEFKDNRAYVHSTTMIEQLNRIIYENFYPENTWDVPLLDAKFHKEVAQNGSFFISEDLPENHLNEAASASFRFYDRHRTLHVFLIEGNVDVTRRIRTNYRVEDLILEKDFSGTCRILCSNRASFTENVIEANKRIHLLTIKDYNPPLKVINLYMKKFPATVPEGAKDLLMKIVNISARSSGNSMATLNALWFPSLELDKFELAYVVQGTEEQR